MTHVLLCDCGARYEGAPAAGKVYCSRCGALLAYGEGPAVSMPLDPGVPAPRQRRRRRRRVPPRQRAKTTPEESPAGPALGTSTFVPDPDTRGKSGRRQRLPPDAGAQQTPRRLLAWIDPVTFLWLPVLVPPLAGGSGTIIVASQLASYRGIGVPFLFLGTFLSLVPLAFLLWHASSVLVAWGTGARGDPGWPTLDVVEMYHNLVRWLCSLAATLLVFGPLWWLIAHGGWKGPPEAQLATTVALAGPASLYFCLTLLGVSMWEDLLACSPWFVMRTAWRLRWRLVPFAGELWLGLAALYFAVVAVGRAVAHDVVLGILIWACWWTLFIFWLLRLMRALGAMCDRNQKRLGWFRS